MPVEANIIKPVVLPQGCSTTFLPGLFRAGTCSLLFFPLCCRLLETKFRDWPKTVPDD